VPLPSIPAGLYVEAWPPMLAVRGPGMCRALHTHHAMHFVLAVDSELRVRTTNRGRWTTAAGVLTAPDVPHAIDACGGDQVVIFFDPESDVGAALRPALSGPVRLTSSAERAALVRGVEDPIRSRVPTPTNGPIVSPRRLAFRSENRGWSCTRRFASYSSGSESPELRTIRRWRVWLAQWDCRPAD
jgi:hypothetical protein